MAISYNGLWKQSVKLSVLEKICKELDCNFGDLIDYVPDNKEK